MIRSMTAYTQYEIKSDWGSATWEIRSINHRYLETYFRLSQQFSNLEPIIRERIRSRLARGKIECRLNFEPSVNMKETLNLNKGLAKQLVDNANWVKMQSKEGRIDPVDILYWPGVMTAQKQDFNAVAKEILIAFDKTLDDFIIAREREGKALKILIKQDLKKINEEIVKIRLFLPDILQWQKKRLVTKLEDAQIQFENNRIDQEIVLMAQRIDVDEELNRIEIHVKEVFNILKKKEAVGRRLDFMMQELNRESNTLASKSININITNSAIELKVLIEQIREQIQNIE